MQQAKYETTSVKIQGGEYYFTVAASKLKFPGFMTVYTQEDEEKQENQLLVKAKYLCAYHYYYYCQTLCSKRKQKSIHDGIRRSGK